MVTMDIARLRADTPGCATALHLNNAGAALLPRPVYEALTAHLAREYATDGYEANFAATLGLGAAVEYALALGVPAIGETIARQAPTLRAGLAAIPGVTIEDRGAALCGIVGFSVAGSTPHALRLALRERRDRPDGTATARPINVSETTPPSTTLDAVRATRAWTRASVHCYNSDAELTEFLTAIAAFAARPTLSAR